MAVLLPTVFVYFFLNFLKQITPKRKLVVFVIGAIILGGLIHSASNIHPSLNLASIMDEVASNTAMGVRDSNEGNYIEYIQNDNSLLFFVINAPKALIYGLFGPFIWESKNLPMLYIGFENLLLLIGFLFVLFKIVQMKLKLSALAWSLIFYIVVLSLFLSLSTPNFGTLTRYKVSYLPFLFILIYGNITFVNEFLRKLFNFFDIRKK